MPSFSSARVVVAFSLLLAPACGRDSLVLEQEAELSNNLVVLPVRVNGSRPMPFILDTGASTNVIDRRQAGSLGLAVAGGVDVTTGGGDVDASEIEGVTLEIGDMSLRNLNAVAIDLSGLASGLGRPVAGILGYDIFQRYVVAIDYSRQVVTFHEPARYRPPDAGEAIPISIEENIPFVRARIPGLREPSEAKLEFDTGKTGALTLVRPYVDAAMLLKPGQREVAITAGALLPGQVPAVVTRIQRLQLGGFGVRDVVTTVVPTQDAAGVSGDTVGILGAEVLARSTVVIDYSRRQVNLLVRHAERDDQPFEFDMSGISMAAQGPEHRDYLVRLVIPESPAEEAGLQAGDRLIAIDGRPTREIALGDIRELFRKDGVLYALELQRGQAIVRADLRTRRLL